MYTHCRQFPHFQGASDSEIRSAVVNAMSERPRLCRLMRLRKFLILIAVAVAVYLLNNGTTSGLGFALMVSGGVATGIILLWNLAWLNWVLFPITSDGVDKSGPTPD